MAVNRNYAGKRMRLGEILISKNLLTQEQLEHCLKLQKTTGKPLGRIFVEEEYITDEDLQLTLGEQLGIPHIWLRKGLIDPQIVQVLPKDKASLFKVIPMFRVNNVLTLASSDPNGIFAFDEVSKITGCEIQPVLCREADISEAIDTYYQDEMNIDEIMNSIDDSGVEVIQSGAEREVSELAEMAEGSPVINLTNMILLKAIRDGASDIHIEPQPSRFRIRVRIDGVLYELMSPKVEMQPLVVSRLKIMANLDIAERRIPQDGRIQVHVDGRTVDLRFSSMPGIHGEKLVLRILDKSRAVLDINKLGFDEDILDQLKGLLRRPHGLILVCGPTGSGKTTTLYSAINMLNTSDKNIITIEDPVEYQLENINQNQVKEAIGLTFAKFLKHALRQDPDIVLVGEIRDKETAEIAIQASLTGHLVLSTLHTNDSPSTITRMLEMGIEPYLLSSSLMACVAQRLIRTICPECKTEYYPPKEVLDDLGKKDDNTTRLSRGKGCGSCYDSGYKGRVAVIELLEIDSGLQRLMLKDPTVNALGDYLEEKGYHTLQDSGYRKALDGITTIEEVKRVSRLGV
jgi:type IV pilus assembly protein PilB